MFARNKGNVGGGHVPSQSSRTSPGSSEGTGAGGSTGFPIITKGYRYTQSAAQLESLVVGIRSGGGQTEPVAEGHAAEYVAVPLLNGDSYEVLNPFFEFRAVDLDAASGAKFHFFDIGDPGKTGDAYLDILVEGARVELQRAAAEYAQNIHATGRGDNLRLHEMRILAQGWMITDDELPCLVFLRRGNRAAVEILSIPLEWYDTLSARRAFGRVLREWLATWKTVANVSGNGSAGAGSISLKQSLANLRRNVDAEIRGIVAASDGCEFRPEGDAWRVGYEGVSRVVRDSRGMAYIAYLLDHPERPVAARELQLAIVGGIGPKPSHGMPDLDEAGHQALSDALPLLEERRESARSAGNLERLDDLEEQIAQVNARLRTSVGKSGRMRRTGDDRERARRAVSQAVDRAIGHIREAHPAAGRHLHATITRGAQLVYRPGRPMIWTH